MDWLTPVASASDCCDLKAAGASVLGQISDRQVDGGKLPQGARIGRPHPLQNGRWCGGAFSRFKREQPASRSTGWDVRSFRVESGV